MELRMHASQFYVAGAIALAILTTLAPAHLSLAATQTATDALQPAETAPAPKAPQKQVLPKEISDLCPVYPGAKFFQATKTSSLVRGMFSTKDDDLKKLSDWYKMALTKGGWVVIHERMEPSSARLVLRKDGKQVGFAAQKQPNGLVTFFLSIINQS